ncbi:MAG: hypothetical protein ACRDJ1_03960 [Actinomycetota bacterium]
MFRVVRTRVAATVFVVFVAASAFGCSQSGGYIAGTDVKTYAGADARPGQLINFGFVIDPSHDATVHLLDVRPLGVPESIEIVSVWADNLAAGNDAVGVLRGDLPALYPNVFQKRSIGEATLIGSGPRTWQVIVTIRSLALGHHEIEALVVTYEVGERRFEETLPYRFAIDVIDCERTPQSSSVCSGEPEPPITATPPR